MVNDSINILKKMKNLDIFIEGELIDLCIPTLSFARESNWYSWFNSKNNTKYLEQGAFPNTADDQVDFLNTNVKDRFMLIIFDKKNSKYCGIVSLSKINLDKKSCEIAIVSDTEKANIYSSYIALEAMAKMIEHAFTQIGIRRITAGQHIKLFNWQSMLELIGMRIEGVHRNKFIKGVEVSDTVTIAITYPDFEKITIMREGFLWDNFTKMKKRITGLPRETFAKKLKKLFIEDGENYYKTLFDL